MIYLLLHHILRYNMKTLLFIICYYYIYNTLLCMYRLVNMLLISIIIHYDDYYDYRFVTVDMQTTFTWTKLIIHLDKKETRSYSAI